MAISSSHLAYKDCYAVMDQAVEDSVGVRVEMDDYDKALHFRMRLHQARAIDRRRNAGTYPPDHPMHGLSAYDKLVCRIRQEEGKFWVYLERNTLRVGQVEPLSATSNDQLVPLDEEPVDEVVLPEPTDDPLAEVPTEIPPSPPTPEIQRIARRV